MSKKNEVEYEAPAVEIETPTMELETPKRESQKGIKAFLRELNGCWCGKNVPGCDGSGSRVTHLFKNYYNFTCPNGHNNTRVKPAVRQSAVNAGLIKEESNG